MSTASDPVLRRKLSDEMFDRLKLMITSGDLRPGDALPSERELMERFAVGRPAIREAMQALGAMGLLSISQGERARVRQITARSIIQQVDAAAHIMLITSAASLDHLKQARRFFERGMAREAALKATEQDIAALEATLDLQRACLGEPEAFITADIRLHVQIAALSGNPIFESVSEAMLNWLRHYHAAMLIWTGKEHYTLAEHVAIIEKIATHDPEGAEAAMARHLDRSAALYAQQGRE